MNRKLVLASVVLLMASVCHAGDVVLSADGFPQNHRGNGQFTLKQVINPSTGKATDCWTQNSDNDGWVMSYASAAQILTVTYCRNGAPLAVYRVTGVDLTAQNVGLTTNVTTGQVPRMVSIMP